MPDLANDVIEKVLRIAKENRNDCVRVEFGGRALLSRHCGMRMARVKVFYAEGEDLKGYEHCETHAHRGVDEHVCVCPDCSYHYAAIIQGGGY